jgi:uncharacterized membrane protein YgcG
LTITSLRREPPMLEPDDAFVARLAELARTSRPTPSGVAVLGGATGRSLAAAAAVAAIAAGTAVAAGQMNHSHPLPAPPVSTQGTDNPTAPVSPSDRQSHEGRQVGAGHKDGPAGATENADATAPVLILLTQTPGGHQGPNPGPGSDDPATEDPDEDSTPSDEPSDEASENPSESPSEGPSETSGESPSGAPSSESSDGSSDGGDGGNSGGGSSDASPNSESTESSGTGGHDGSGLMEFAD